MLFTSMYSFLWGGGRGGNFESTDLTWVQNVHLSHMIWFIQEWSQW